MRVDRHAGDAPSEEVSREEKVAEESAFEND
jgi:hypothetical protein